MEVAAGGEDGEEPPREARVLGSELVDTYTVRGWRKAAAHGGGGRRSRGWGSGRGEWGGCEGRRWAARGLRGEVLGSGPASGSLRGTERGGPRPCLALR